MLKRQIDTRTGVSLSVIAALLILVFHIRHDPGPYKYRYETFTSQERIQLHIIRTAADNIEPIAIATNLKDSGPLAFRHPK